MKKVIITGITGQDGAYLSRDLLKLGYEVIGLVRRGSTPKIGRLRHLGILDQIKLISCEITEFANVVSVLKEINPSYIYNLAANSFVADSFKHPQLTFEINNGGVLNLLEAIRLLGIDCSLYQASTSEMYGEILSDPQCENTPFNPRSPYAISKLSAHYLIKNYRAAFRMRCASGILFNHESELRGREFVTRKITSGIANLKINNSKPIELGNMSAVRDWGHAEDYVKGMQLICEAHQSDDFVLSTNATHSVREFLELSAHFAGFEPRFEGQDTNERCICARTGRELAIVNPDFFRPAEVEYLRGDYGKAEKELGWSPKIKFEDLVRRMVSFDLDLAQKGDFSV